MAKERLIIKGISKNQSQIQSVDENRPNNFVKPQQKKIRMNGIKEPIKPVQTVDTIQRQPFTSYRSNSTEENLDELKWTCLTKFQQMNAKAHYIHNLKNSTIFLGYSLAEKTVDLVLSQRISFQYWATCCLFMSMKYEEIYPPRLRDLQGIIKAPIDLKLYWDAELTIWSYIGMDMNFVSLNTRLSEILHAISKKDRFFVFFYLELALYRRNQFKQFSQKQILLAIIQIFTSQKVSLSDQELIDGTPFQKIYKCAKKIIMCQIQAQGSNSFIFKKYQMETRDCVALKALPHLDGLRNLLISKTNEPQKTPKIIGFCPQVQQKSQMVDESTEKVEVNYKTSYTFLR